jgi:hypothetical protein
MMKTRSVLVVFALLWALCAACYKKSDYSPTAPLANQVITLSSSTGVATLPADGFSRLHLEARLPGDPAFANRVVIFTTTSGTLSGGTAGTNCNNACQNVTADGSGIARIDLISAAQVGTAVVTATPSGAAGITASLSISFVAATPDDTIHFVAAPTRVQADGATLTTYTVAISPSLPPASRTVTFQTTAAGTTFVAPTSGQSIPVPVDAGGQASADLRSPVTITTGRVSATINGVTREVVVSFEQAVATTITVGVDNAVVPAAAATKVRVTATLRHNQGFVTDGTQVSFNAMREGSTASLGIFTNVTLTTNGVATADFLPNTTTGGVVILTVGAQGTERTGTARILLTAAAGG